MAEEGREDEGGEEEEELIQDLVARHITNLYYFNIYVIIIYIQSRNCNIMHMATSIMATRKQLQPDSAAFCKIWYQNRTLGRIEGTALNANHLQKMNITFTLTRVICCSLLLN